MKVVLFCGGLGMRMRDYSEMIPKPMVRLRYRPLLWHVMKYYAFYGHTDFILCLGHKGDMIKEYFLNYSECQSNDFVLSDGGRRIEVARRDIADWRITFVDTGLAANIGQRLRAVQPYLEGEEVFLANYSDGLTDCPLPRIIERFRETRAVATFLAVHPSASFHIAELGVTGTVRGIHDVKQREMWINGGYFVLHRDIFQVLGPGEELVEEPFGRLIEQNLLSAHRHEGFWRGIDTFKDMQEMETLVAQDAAPWEAWRKLGGLPGQAAAGSPILLPGERPRAASGSASGTSAGGAGLRPTPLRTPD